MPDEKKPVPIEQQLAALRADNAALWQQIRGMQKIGGFADSKALSVRSTRLEERMEKAEADVEMLKDVMAESHTLIGEHLRDRHDADIDREDSPDVVPWRRWRRRMREWAAKRGLTDKRRDITEARQSENRLRPARVEQ